MSLLYKILFTCLLIGLPTSSFSGVLSTDGSRADVQAKLNVAKAGDTVAIPAGTFIWSSGVDIGGTGSDQITLQGAGENNTTITQNFNGELITVSSGTGMARVTSFTINGNYKDAPWGHIIIMSSGHRPQFRVDHIAINNAMGNGIVVAPGDSRCQPYYIYGLIDHITFRKGGNTGINGISVYGYCRAIAPDGTESGQNAWTEGDMAGTANAVYVEDSTFDYGTYGFEDGVFDVYDQGRIVFRYNTVIGTAPGVHGFDSSLGLRWMELYNNTFHNSQDGWNWRGGSGVVFNNIATGIPINAGPVLQVYRVLDPYHGGKCPLGNVDGYPVGDSNWDAHGYPCRYQPGRGQNNSLSPLYFWNNTNYAPIVDPQGGGVVRDFIKENRDFYVGVQKPGYTPYTYPHPLQGSSPVPKIPMPPSNVKIIN
jgi:hypothetical protein